MPFAQTLTLHRRQHRSIHQAVGTARAQSGSVICAPRAPRAPPHRISHAFSRLLLVVLEDVILYGARTHQMRACERESEHRRMHARKGASGTHPRRRPPAQPPTPWRPDRPSREAPPGASERERGTSARGAGMPCVLPASAHLLGVSLGEEHQLRKHSLARAEAGTDREPTRQRLRCRARKPAKAHAHPPPR